MPVHTHRLRRRFIQQKPIPQRRHDHPGRQIGARRQRTPEKSPVKPARPTHGTLGIQRRQIQGKTLALLHRLQTRQMGNARPRPRRNHRRPTQRSIRPDQDSLKLLRFVFSGSFLSFNTHFNAQPVKSNSSRTRCSKKRSYDGVHNFLSLINTFSVGVP